MGGKGTFGLALAVAVCLVSAWGCYLDPGTMDAGLVARYQRTLATRGPQRRGGTEGIESLRPVTNGPKLDIGTDPRSGREAVRLSLDEAIQRALANSLEIKVVSFDPGIAREDVARAAAEFDVTVFGGLNYDVVDNKTDSVFSGGHSKTRAGNLGFRGKTVTGATWEGQGTWTRAWDNQSFRTLPTRHEPTLTFKVAQPLLRDAWCEVNLASLHVARLNHRQSLAQFRQKVEEVVANVITTYWRLVQARQDLEIQKTLLTKTRETLDRIRKRGLIDATKVQVKQAESAVESRRAALIRAGKVIFDVQDQLARLLADKQINLVGHYAIVPTTDPATVKVQVDATDQLVTALRHNAVLQQARLAIDVAGVSVAVAKNQTLPRLDISASGGLQGQGPTRNAARESINTGDYASWSAGITFEYPFGNRERRADLRKRRLERLKAVVTLQDLADQVAVQIHERVRQINTAYEEMLAQHTAVEAASAQLDALEVKEQRTPLSPEFLQVKLQAQESVAAAARGELQATIEYNAAMSDLARIAGTILDIHNVKVEGAMQPPPLPVRLPDPDVSPTPAPAGLPTIPPDAGADIEADHPPVPTGGLAPAPRPSDPPQSPPEHGALAVDVVRPIPRLLPTPLPKPEVYIPPAPVADRPPAPPRRPVAKPAPDPAARNAPAGPLPLSMPLP